MTKLDSVLKNRDITLLIKICIFKAMIFPVVMYECESRLQRRLSTEELISLNCVWCWRRFLRVCRTARRSNQSILKEINPEYSLEELMLKLKLQYFDHLMRKASSLEKILMLERLKAGGKGHSRG